MSTRSVLLRAVLLAAALVPLAGCGGGERSLLLLDELPRVGTVDFVGNRAFDDATLRGLMTLRGRSVAHPFRSQRFSERTLDSDILAVTTWYVRHGYLRARVTHRERHEHDGVVDVTLTLDEGAPVTVRDVALLLDDRDDPAALTALGLDPERALSRLKVGAGRPLDLYAIDDDRRTLARDLAERGYLRAEVGADVQFTGDDAVGFYSIDPDTVYRIGEVTFAGNRRLPDGVLRRELAFRPGDRYRLSRVVKTQEGLLQSGYFTDVRWDTLGVDPATGTAGVRFTVRERKMRWVEGGFGVSSKNRLRLTGTWGTRSFRRSGARLALVNRADIDLGRSVGSYVDEARSELLYLRRHVFGTDWESQPSGFFIYDREVDYEQNIWGLALNNRRLLGDPRNQVVLSVENRWVFNNADSTAKANDIQLERERYQTRVVSGLLQLDSRNDFFDPGRGGTGELRIDLAGGALGGNNGFRKATASTRRFVTPGGGRFTLAWRLQLGGIDPTRREGAAPGQKVLSAELVPAEDRYRLGGANSVRGYSEDELDGATAADGIVGGVISLLGNMEVRTRLVYRFSLVTFLDAGNVWQDPSQFGWNRLVPHAHSRDVDPREVRYAYGAGLRFGTPVGPIRLDYARKWNAPGIPGGTIDRTKWHVSLGHAF